MIELTESQQRRKASARIFKAIRRTWAKLKGTRPARDAEYLAWLRTQSCAIAECTSWGDQRAGFARIPPVTESLDRSVIEAAHVGAIRGLGQKCSDREAIPLCAYHHRTGPIAHHVLGKEFWPYWKMNREETIEMYNQLFEQERA